MWVCLAGAIMFVSYFAWGMRLRVNPQCRNCRYDMSATTERCPECGWIPRSRESVHRRSPAHVHWIVAIILMCGALVAWAFDQHSKGSFAAKLPTVALLRLFESDPGREDQYWEELAARCQNNLSVNEQLLWQAIVYVSSDNRFTNERLLKMMNLLPHHSFGSAPSIESRLRNELVSPAPTYGPQITAIRASTRVDLSPDTIIVLIRIAGEYNPVLSPYAAWRLSVGDIRDTDVAKQLDMLVNDDMSDCAVDIQAYIAARIIEGSAMTPRDAVDMLLDAGAPEEMIEYIHEWGVEDILFAPEG